MVGKPEVTPPPDTAAARTAQRRQLVTFIRDPGDDVPRTFCRARAQGHSLARGSSASDDERGEEAKMLVTRIYDEVDTGADERNKDLGAGIEVFYAMMAR